MIRTLLITIVVETIIAGSYAARCKKPVRSILLTAIFANFLTQSLLWLVLSFFFQDYLPALFTAEVLIWFLEGICFYSLRTNRLNFLQSLLLSFYMNIASFGIGWFLPV